MTRKSQGWIGALVAVLLIAGTLALIRGQTPRPVIIRGAVLVESTDPHKQQPIAGVIVSAGDLAISDTKTDSSGSFSLTLHTLIRRGHAIDLTFRNPQYHPLDLKEFVSNKLYVVHLAPLTTPPEGKSQPDVKVTNVRVRYIVTAMSEVNVGSAARTFEVKNVGNVPCNGQHPCSPDGRWKANLSSASVDAGPGNVFRDARTSCIAGPCPFTRIDADRVSQGGQIVNVSALDWSDTATFLFEAEVFRPMMNQVEHWSYPVIFGESLSFTLPPSASSVSVEADTNGTTVIFPLGPTTFLSWAACDVATDRDNGRIFRCTAKPGYTFQ